MARTETQVEAEHLSYKAKDWHSIATDLPYDDFGKHLYNKSYEVRTKKGDDFVFGETVTKDQAKSIRTVAKDQGAKEIKSTGGGQ